MTTTYTMNDFINNKLAVRVNEDNILDFLKMCEEKGLVWASGEKATDFVPSTAKCIAFGLVSENTLTYSCNNESTIYAAHGYTFIDFSQFFPTKYQIVIESDGDTTTAKMVVNGKEVKTSTAKRNPADKANWHIGAQTAFDRLWERQPKPEKPTKSEVREVKRNAKVGEWVRIVNATNLWNEAYKNDDILQVERAYSDGATYLSCGGVYALPYEYVVLEGYQP